MKPQVRETTAQVAKRYRVYDFVCHCVYTRGWPPTHREIAKHMGLNSTSTVAMHLQRLVADGKLEWRENGYFPALLSGLLGWPAAKWVSK